MEYRELGSRTGLRVSVIGLGAWGIGGKFVPDGPVPESERVPNNYGDVSEEEAQAILRAALDSGVNLIDTAPFYGAGRSEERIGRALRGRDDVIIASKVGVWVYPGGREGRSFTREVVNRQLDESRRRLQREVVDIELIHSPNYDEYGNGESMAALHDAKAAGKVRFIGVSIHSSGPAREFIERDEVDVLEIPLNLLRPQTADVLPLAEAHGVGIIVREPLANGRLTDTFHRDIVFGPEDRRRFWPRERVIQDAERVERLAVLWGDGRRTAPQAALQWILTHGAVATVIPGAMSIAELRESLAVPDLPPLTAEELNRVRPLQATWAAVRV